MVTVVNIFALVVGLLNKLVEEGHHVVKTVVFPLMTVVTVDNLDSREAVDWVEECNVIVLLIVIFLVEVY